MEGSRVFNEPEITKFNSNSKGFSLGWDVKEHPHPTPIISKKKEEIKEVGITQRDAKFLHKKNNDITTSVTRSEIQPTMDRELKSNIAFNDVPKSTNTSTLTAADRAEMKQKQKEETAKLNDDKVSKMQDKARTRESFKF